MTDIEHAYGDLRALAALAQDAELPLIAEEAAALSERLSAGRLFVACVGQFKRGKSSVLNALVGESVLPVGVTPVTSAVTILRYGERRGATVFYAAGPSEQIPVEDVPLYVAEEHNHENARGVSAVEVFLPSPFLEGGLCLVDTPGIGSAFAGNTEATRAFVPHIDAALVVLGADPPISGEELTLVLDVLAQAPNAIFVLNKTDRLPQHEVAQAMAFTERLVAERLGRGIGPVLEISAAERIDQHRATRDWRALEESLASLTGEAAVILRQSHERGRTRLAKMLADDLEERRGALLRPLEESETRIELLRRSVADADIMLRQVGVLLASEQRELLGEFQRRQSRFVETELTLALAELTRSIEPLPSGDLRDRARAFDEASTIARRRIDAWLKRMEPEADLLYRDATRRFTSLANDFLARLAACGDAAFASLPRSLEPEAGLREPRRYYATELMSLTAPGLINRVLFLVLPRASRIERITGEAGVYLERLLRSNTTRVVFDLEQRVEASRRKLESELRFLLQQITSSAQRALDRARAHQAAGNTAVTCALAEIAALHNRLREVVEHARR